MEQSIQRKLFGTDGIRGKANHYPMIPELALLVGKAVAIVLLNQNKKRKHRIVIGKDTRISNYMLEAALQAGICSMGCDVFLVGPMPTPGIAHLTKSLNADAGIVISASHNPAEDNGIKIFGSDGYKLSDEIELKIEKLVLSKEISSEHITGEKIGKAYRLEEAYGRYIEFTKSSINSMDLSGIKAVIDCANGASYSIAPKIFSELGVDIIMTGIQPDGLNINLNCGSLHPENISSLVKKNKADVGIAFDGDADRIIMCDENGEIITGDLILGIIAKQMKQEGTLFKDTAVITVMSNFGVKEFFRKHNINFVETKVGDRYIIEEMRKNNFNLGGEQSGHIILGNYTTTGDGIITALQMLKIMKKEKKPLSKIMSQIKKYPQITINIKVKEKKDINSLKAKKLIDFYIKKLSNRGRILVRYSGTEKICRVMVESDNFKDTKNISYKISEEIKKEIGEKN